MLTNKIVSRLIREYEVFDRLQIGILYYRKTTDERTPVNGDRHL